MVGNGDGNKTGESGRQQLTSLISELEMNLMEVKNGIAEIDDRKKVHQAKLEAEKIMEAIKRQESGKKSFSTRGI